MRTLSIMFAAIATSLSGLTCIAAPKIALKTNLIGNGHTVIEKGGVAGIDFKYFTFDVNARNMKALDSGRDACFVRTVSSSAER